MSGVFDNDGSSSAAAASNGEGTYEATKARQSTIRQPDKINWKGEKAFRDCPYRQLHHQAGLVGSFKVRLLEASGLQRSYWSALALGPVKHLGWSKAHGAVSSYCSFQLDFEPCRKGTNGGGSGVGGSGDYNNHRDGGGGDRKPAAQVKPVFVSPVVPSDSNPVWDNCQFDAPLRKGSMSPTDGMRVILRVRVDEDSTAIENLLPGVPGSGDNARLLGVGKLDVTELCLGETTMTGQPLPGVRDAWIPITLKGQEEDQQQKELLLYHQQRGQKHHPDDPLAPPSVDKQKGQLPKPPPVTGMVRVLVSYQPWGMEPQPNDIVALEAFARRFGPTSSCLPLINSPLQPLTVLERRGSYLLCEYALMDGRTACVRLHRNAVFVIERQNAVDASLNLALMPVDFVKSTPIGQATIHALGPVVAAGREVMLPALLSLKLVWVAARTTTLAGLSGVQALGGTLWHEGTSSLTASHRNGNVPVYGGGDGSRHSDGSASSRRRDSSATAQFVSL